jgi:hypothetical protein
MAGYSVPDFTWLYQGLPASGGSLYVYQTGTTTPVTIYSDGGLTTPITNPGTLDANGALKFYVSGSVNLRLDAYTSTGQFIQSIDPVYPVSGSSGSTGQVVYEGSNITLSTTNNVNNIISTAAINIALPITTGFTNSFQVELNAQGGAITLIPNATDKINGGTAGASFVISKGSSAVLWTDAAGNWGTNFLTNANPTKRSFANLQAGWVSNTTFSVYCEEAVLENASGQTIKVVLPSGATNTITNTGVNGIDTASVVINTNYSCFIISNGTTVASLISLSATPALPSGYTYYAAYGTISLDGGAHIRGFQQFGNRMTFTVGSNLSALPSFASGAAGNVSTPTFVTFNALSFSTATTPVPVVRSTGILASSPSGQTILIAPNNSYSLATGNFPPIYTAINGGSGLSVCSYWFPVENANLYYATANANCNIQCIGYEYNW